MKFMKFKIEGFRIELTVIFPKMSIIFSFGKQKNHLWTKDFLVIYSFCILIKNHFFFLKTLAGMKKLNIFAYKISDTHASSPLIQGVKNIPH